MRLIYLNSKQEFNDFIGSQEMSQFLQSWQWGDFQDKTAGKIFRLGVEDEGKVVATATLIKKALPLGKGYFYCPRGPVIGTKKSEVRNENKKLQIIEYLFDEIKKLAGKENAIFLRLEPIIQLPITNYQSLISRTIDVQPSKTLVLDLSKSEVELLTEMHPKTRYNIKLAEKKGLVIKEKNLDSFNDFWLLMEDTVKRDGFRLHAKSYYKAMLGLDSDFIKLYFAEINGKPISAAIFAFFGDTVTYMHGASSNSERNLMAPYLLQWRTIVSAKKLGYKYYDFYGLDEKKWPGVTRFKRGFGGKEIIYPGTFDLAFNRTWYNIYRIIRKLKRTF